MLPALKHSSIIDIREKLKRILKGFFSLVQDYCGLAKKIFYLSIILITWDAVVYMRGYYSDLSYDNMFVDDNLRELWRLWTEGENHSSPKMGTEYEVPIQCCPQTF